MEPIDYVRGLIRRWPIIAIGAFIGAAFAFVGTDPKPAPATSTFTATHTLLITEPTQFGQQPLVGTITFNQVPVFATTGEVPRRVAQELGYEGAPAALAAQLQVNADQETGTLRFTTQQTDPEQAVRLADAFADETVRYLAQRQQDLRQQRQTKALQEVDQLEAQVRQLDQAIAQQLAARAPTQPGGPAAQADSITQAQRDAAVREYATAYESYRSLAQEEDTDLNLTTLERAQPVKVQSGGFSAPRTRSTRVPIGAAIGALLGAGVALLAERLDVRIRDRRRAEEAFVAGVVAELPTLNRTQRAARLVVAPTEHDPAAEAFRSLRTSITFMATGGRPAGEDPRIGTVLVTSPSPAEGKTTVAVNLAAAFAETGRTVLLVNADFRRPAVSALVTEGPSTLPGGLGAIGRVDPERFLVPTRIPGVELLDLGPLGGTPADLPRATIRLVAALQESVDVIVVDTPPLNVTAEALEFIPVSTVVLLIARVGRTTAAAAGRAGELVRFGGAEQIAVALTNVAPARRRLSYYDYYGGRRGGGAHPAATEVVVPAASEDAVTGEPADGQPAGDEWREIDELVDRDADPSEGRADGLPTAEGSPPAR
jgi:Mrp family chromosome partitioning ATPase/capsular polysaccharide biosynthesis protein